MLSQTYILFRPARTDIFPTVGPVLRTAACRPHPGSGSLQGYATIATGYPIQFK